MPLALAVYNLKGGVGKTAAAVNLAYLAAAEGYRTLLWDLDPQGAASFYLRVDEPEGQSPDLWLKPKHFHERIRGSDYANLDIVPASLALRHLDVELAGRKHAKTRLPRLIEGLPEQYEFVVLDCAPSLSFTSDNLFALADHVLVPVIPTQLSIRAYAQLEPFARRPDQLLPFFSMVDRRRRLHRDLIVQFAREHDQTLERYVPYASEVEKMGEYRAPIEVYARGSLGARAFRGLWAALKTRVDFDARVG